jgi:hypothetical protein
LQGGSEIWLQTSNAWGKKQDKRVGNNNNNTNTNEADTAAETRVSNEYTSALRRYGVKEDTNEEKVRDDDVGSKWWCKFGHSRRGLEHIVSVEEGRQRQRLVNASIAAVLEEQRRQRLTRRDPKKIGAISMQYTSWAKDVALAAAEADEEAVRSNFHIRAKGRLSYLSSKLSSQKGKAGAGAGNVQGQPCASLILSANPALTAEVLDSHRHRSVSALNSNGNVNGKNMNGSGSNHSTSAESMKNQAAGFQYQEATA